MASKIELKKAVSKVVKNFYRSMLASETEREISRLKKIPRYAPGRSNLFGVNFNFVDAVTFVGGYLEIIRNRIYDFRSGTETPLIIDCGANIGLSVYYFKTLYPKSRLMAYEPDPHIFKTLKTNVESLGFTGVELFQEAIWVNNGKLQFQVEGGFSGRIPKPGDSSGLIDVPCKRLRDLLDQKVDFLKIDIEGAEFDVIKDIQDKLQNVENIFIEYHSHQAEAQSLDEILRMLKDSGFRYHIQEAYTRKRPFVERETMLGMDLQLNLFGYRSN